MPRGPSSPLPAIERQRAPGLVMRLPDRGRRRGSLVLVLAGNLVSRRLPRWLGLMRLGLRGEANC